MERFQFAVQSTGFHLRFFLTLNCIYLLVFVLSPWFLFRLYFCWDLSVLAYGTDAMIFT